MHDNTTATDDRSREQHTASHALAAEAGHGMNRGETVPAGAPDEIASSQSAAAAEMAGRAQDAGASALAVPSVIPPVQHRASPFASGVMSARSRDPGQSGSMSVAVAAEQARSTGKRFDLLRYLRLRRKT